MSFYELKKKAKDKQKKFISTAIKILYQRVDATISKTQKQNLEDTKNESVSFDMTAMYVYPVVILRPFKVALYPLQAALRLF
jgi:hypothetical protein